MDAGLCIYFRRDLARIFFKVFDGQDIYFFLKMPAPPPSIKCSSPNKKRDQFQLFLFICIIINTLNIILNIFFSIFELKNNFSIYMYMCTSIIFCMLMKILILLFKKIITFLETLHIYSLYSIITLCSLFFF